MYQQSRTYRNKSLTDRREDVEGRIAAIIDILQSMEVREPTEK